MVSPSYVCAQVAVMGGMSVVAGIETMGTAAIDGQWRVDNRLVLRLRATTSLIEALTIRCFISSDRDIQKAMIT